jgi:hypothetical protein
MNNFSLYQRFISQGTLTEPKGVPNPFFALPSTVHWMRALALLVKSEVVNYKKAWKFYSSINKCNCSDQQENSILEHLLLALHQLSALQSMANIKNQADIARVASIGWYYGIYASASAMVAAQDGSVQDNHTKTAKTWDRQLVQHNRVLHPFDLRISTLVKADAKKEIDAIRRGPAVNLVNAPKNKDEAYQAICGYLSGNANWWREKSEDDLRQEKEFKLLGVSSFRTKKARTLRDQRLNGQCISFLHQAIRFRGKANYREALYLAHGPFVKNTIASFVSDMAIVLEAFLAMAGAFAFKRIGSNLKEDFIRDIEKNRSFAADPRKVWTK